jgi:hypothetical protein
MYDWKKLESDKGKECVGNVRCEKRRYRCIR